MQYWSRVCLPQTVNAILNSKGMPYHVFSPLSILLRTWKTGSNTCKCHNLQREEKMRTFIYRLCHIHKKYFTNYSICTYSYWFWIKQQFATWLAQPWDTKGFVYQSLKNCKKSHGYISTVVYAYYSTVLYLSTVRCIGLFLYIDMNRGILVLLKLLSLLFPKPMDHVKKSDICLTAEARPHRIRCVAMHFLFHMLLNAYRESVCTGCDSTTVRPFRCTKTLRPAVCTIPIHTGLMIDIKRVCLGHRRITVSTGLPRLNVTISHIIMDTLPFAGFVLQKLSEWKL